MKRIKIGDEYFRLRRGKLVKIPDDWVGKTTHKQTINKRNRIKRRTRKEK